MTRNARADQRTSDWYEPCERTCSACGGSGSEVDACRTCRGTGNA